MNKKLLSLVFALGLLVAVPVRSQMTTMPTPMPAAGAGGGGDASAANQATQITALPLEDVAHVSGDRGSFSLGVENSDLTAFTAGDKDYTPFGVTSLGQMIGVPMLSGEIATANQLGKAEGVLHVTGDAGIPALVIRNSATTPTAITGLDLRYSMIGVTSLTQVLTTQHHSTAYLTSIQVSKLEDTAHATGDAGIPNWGIVNADLSSLAASENDYVGQARAASGAGIVAAALDATLSGAISLGKLEDSAHSTGHAGVPAWTVGNEALATFGATGDYLPRGADRTGAAFSVPLVSDFISINRQIGKIEDFPASSGQSGVPAFVVRANTPASSSAADNDWVYMISDPTGHLWTHEFEVGANDFSIDRDNITTASVNIAFGFTSNKVEIRAATGNPGDICVDWAGGTAVCPAANTAGDYRLEAGQILLFDSAAYSSVSIIASTGTNVVNISAWN